MTGSGNELPDNRKLYRFVGWYLGGDDEWRQTRSELLTRTDAENCAHDWDKRVRENYGLPRGKEAEVVVDERAVKAYEEQQRARNR